MDNNGYNGNGTTIAFGTSAIALSVLDISWGGIGAREKIEVSDLSSTTYREYIMTKLLDGGELTLECNYDPDIDPETALTTGSETITITHPIRTSGNTTAGTWACPGAMANYDMSVITNDDKPTVSVTVSVLGAITITAESA